MRWKADKPEVELDWQIFNDRDEPFTNEKGLVFWPTQDKAQAFADTLNKRAEYQRLYGTGK